MTSTIDRRDFGRLLAGTTAAATFASVGCFAAAADGVRLIRWGNPDRDRRSRRDPRPRQSRWRACPA